MQFSHNSDQKTFSIQQFQREENESLTAYAESRSNQLLPTFRSDQCVREFFEICFDQAQAKSKIKLCLLLLPRNAKFNFRAFLTIGQSQRATVLDSMQEMQVTSGQTIIRQGEGGDFFYVIEK